MAHIKHVRCAVTSLALAYRHMAFVQQPARIWNALTCPDSGDPCTARHVVHPCGQSWTQLHFYGDDDAEINLRGSQHPEFETYCWMPLQDVVPQVRENKQTMYKQVGCVNSLSSDTFLLPKHLLLVCALSTVLLGRESEAPAPRLRP